MYVDKNGIMRWGNVSPEKAIDEDVYHFASLGLDACRVNVWDVEISDSAGNLLQNEYMYLFDYLLKKLKGRDIKSILTSIAFTGMGYPESDQKAPGFIAYYGARVDGEYKIRFRE